MHHLWISSHLPESAVQRDDAFSSHFLSVVDEEDYVQANRQLLLDLIHTLGPFPLYVSFEEYHDSEHTLEFLDEEGYVYTIEHLADTRMVMINGETLHYHPPCFKVRVDSLEALEALFDETYYLSTQNQFYAISFSAPAHFLEVFSEEPIATTHSVPSMQDGRDDTLMIISHDGQGIQLVTNRIAFDNADSIYRQLPDSYKLVQLNDELLG